MKNKEWLPIPGIKSYMASRCGMIKRLAYEYYNNGTKTIRPEAIRKATASARYFRVKIFDKSYLVHRLIAITFIPNPENKKFVNHKDGNKLNNRVDNLEWCTSSENSLHAYKTKLRISHVPNGERSPKSKLTEPEVLKIRGLYIAGGHTQQKLADIFSVTKATIQFIVNRNTWKHI